MRRDDTDYLQGDSDNATPGEGQSPSPDRARVPSRFDFVVYGSGVFGAGGHAGGERSGLQDQPSLEGLSEQFKDCSPLPSSPRFRRQVDTRALFG